MNEKLIREKSQRIVYGRVGQKFAKKLKINTFKKEMEELESILAEPDLINNANNLHIMFAIRDYLISLGIPSARVTAEMAKWCPVEECKLEEFLELLLEEGYS